MSFNEARKVIDGLKNVFKNIPAEAVITTEVVTPSSGTPIVLTPTSPRVLTITGTVAQTVNLPGFTGVTAGDLWVINNHSSANLTVLAADGSTVSTMGVGDTGVFRAYITGAVNNGHWIGDLRGAGTTFAAFNGTLAIVASGVQTLYFLPSTTAPAVATLAMWDVQKNLSANSFLQLVTSTAASVTPITLTLNSTQVQVITGTTTAQTINLPTTAIPTGYECVIINQMTTASVTVKASGGTTVGTVGPGQMGVFTAMVSTPTTHLQWALDVRDSTGGGTTSSLSPGANINGVLFTGASNITNRLDQLSAPTASVSMGSQQLTSLADPVNPQDAATKNYTDATVQGLQVKPTADVVATSALPAGTYNNGTSGVGATFTLTATGATVVDGHTLAVGELVLAVAQASAFQNGLYAVTTAGTTGVATVLTRHADMNAAAEFAGAFVPVGSKGTANPNSLWLANPSGAVTVGTTSIPWTELNRAADLSQGTGILISGNQVSVDSTIANLTGSQSFTHKNLTDATNTFPTFNQNTTGSAAKLTTARNIGGVAFDGTANIVPGTATPTVSQTAQWDSNKNFSANSFTPQTTSNVTAAATITMDITYTQVQVFTGINTETVKLPTTSVSAGAEYRMINQSTQPITVQSSGGNTIATLAANGVATFVAQKATPTASADWVVTGLASTVVEYTTTQTGVAVPAGVTGLWIESMIQAGSGGGSGRRGAAASVRCGGGGGASGAMVNNYFVPAALLGTTFTLTLPAVGTGGAAVTADSTNGNPGTSSVAASFASGSLTVSTFSGGGAGAGGTNAAGAGGSAQLGPISGQSGGSASVTGGVGGAGNNTTNGGASSGGSGGGITSADSASAGGAGGLQTLQNGFTTAAGGVVGGASPGAGSAAMAGLGGLGAGGGAASTTAAAQAGATPTGYGAGGGGGGASVNGNNSGAGGNGGPSYARLRWIYV